MMGMQVIMRRAGIAGAGVLAVSAMLACTGTPAGPHLGGHSPGGAAARPALGTVSEVSRGCAKSNAEPIEAVARPAFVYVAWIGCGGIGFARSTDGGRHFGKPMLVPGSRGFTWDPSLAVAANGTVYAGYMRQDHGFMRPVVAASFDHGASFPQVVPVQPKHQGNWGDRDFLATGRHGQVFLTWDYGPSAKKIKIVCSPAGSCAFSAGDINAVIQKSTDGGKTWGPITPVGPHFPRNGGDSAPVLTQPDGRVDVLYLGHVVGKPPGDKIFPGQEFFTSSATGTVWPAHPLKLWPSRGPIAVPVWWIDGSLAMDAGGTLYATWDTQTAGGDIGWLSWSANHGRTWAAPVRVTPGRSKAMHLVQVTGGAHGIAYVGWQTSASPAGYATYVRPYSITKGWLATAVKVSPSFGNPKTWPGDTIGLASLPGTGKLPVSWGSAVGTSHNSQIWATVVSVPGKS
jgi:hypothetical protein